MANPHSGYPEVKQQEEKCYRKHLLLKKPMNNSTKKNSVWGTKRVVFYSLSLLRVCMCGRGWVRDIIFLNSKRRTTCTKQVGNK